MKKIITLVLLTVCLSAAAQDTVSALSPAQNLKLFPVLWQQHAAEYRALCYQAFNFATCRLNDLKLKKKKRYAIITDVDETVLDNSYDEARRLLENREFEMSSWKQWTSKAAATPVPGALEFLQYAAKKGVRIFYLSNRDTSEIPSTVLNLRKFGFPDAEAGQMLFMATTSSKEERRQSVIKDYSVIMMLGDNLNDFARVFEKKDNSSRKLETDSVRNEWGKSFIVLPNATYGEWENALYEYRRGLTPAEKQKALQDKLIVSPE